LPDGVTIAQAMLIGEVLSREFDNQRSEN
jgi:hypothetical protein